MLITFNYVPTQLHKSYQIINFFNKTREKRMRCLRAVARNIIKSREARVKIVPYHYKIKGKQV